MFITLLVIGFLNLLIWISDSDERAEAIGKAKEIYDHVLDEGQNKYSFCADAYSHVKTTFTLE